MKILSLGNEEAVDLQQVIDAELDKIRREFAEERLEPKEFHQLGSGMILPIRRGSTIFKVTITLKNIKNPAAANLATAGFC